MVKRILPYFGRSVHLTLLTGYFPQIAERTKVEEILFYRSLLCLRFA
jgi:hypothetical protein